MPYFKHDGHRLAYTVYGEGPRTTVLLPGLLFSQRMHIPLARELAERGNRVVTLDLLGHGKVTIDRDGNAVHSYHITDELDDRIFRRALVELIRLHDAAGAEAVFTYHRKLHMWRRGEDLEAFGQRVHDASIDPHEHATFALHQMGSCRMGNDPATSVADPWGQLHDVKGVWIGDGSAFPTAPGVNPMVTIMSLAHRTAQNIVS